MSGLRAVTPQNLVLDAGVVYKNINLTELRNGTSTAFTDAIDPTSSWVDPNGVTVSPALMGATKGGSTLTIGKKEREVEFDSRRTYVKNMQRVDECYPSMKTRLLEMGDYQSFEMMLGSATATDWTNYFEIVPSLVVRNTDYIGNIALVAPVSGSSLPIVIVLDNAKVFNPQPLSLQDKSELAVEVEFMGSALASNQYLLPIHVFCPSSTQASGS